MADLRRSKRTVWSFILALLVLLVLSLSPVLAQGADALQSADRLETAHVVPEASALKSVQSHHKLTLKPALPLLFVLLCIASITGAVRLARLEYPTILLLRRRELLLPIKFTSIFVIRSAA